MDKTSVCILTEWYLPGSKAGGPVRSLHSLISILKKDFTISLITTNRDLGSDKNYEDIKPDTWLDNDGVRYYYLSQANCKQENIKRILQQLKPDVIYLNSFWSYLFSIYVVRLKKKNEIKAKVVLAPRGMLGGGALKIKPYKKKVYLSLSKARKLYSEIVFHATNTQEKADIEKHYPGVEVFLAENFNNTLANTSNRNKIPGELDLFYLSRVARIKNLHLALNAISKLPKEISVCYTIYGNIEDENYWKNCLAVIQTLPKHIHVQYKGELTFYEVPQVITKHQFLLLPTQNENFGHSIVESLMAGIPVIISDQTPWTDVEKHGAGFALKIKRDDALVEKLLYCAKIEQNEYLQMSKSAQKYITKKIDLPLIKKKYIALFNERG